MPRAPARPRFGGSAAIRRRFAAFTALAVLAGLAPAVGPDPAGATTLTFTANADAQVAAASPTTNYGRSQTLGVGSSPVVETYVRFSVSGVTGPVARARLRLWVTDAMTDGPAVYLTGTSWPEKKITWSNKPARTGGVLADLGTVPTGARAEFYVTAPVSGNGAYAFDLATPADAGTFPSQE